MTVLERRRWKLLSFSMECRTRKSGICCYRCSGVRQSSTTAEPSWRDSWHSGKGFVVVAVAVVPAAAVVVVVVDAGGAAVVENIVDAGGAAVVENIVAAVVAGNVAVFATGRVVVAAAAAVAPSSACSSFGLKVENYLVFAGQRRMFFRERFSPKEYLMGG